MSSRNLRPIREEMSTDDSFSFESSDDDTDVEELVSDTAYPPDMVSASTESSHLYRNWTSSHNDALEINNTLCSTNSTSRKRDEMDNENGNSQQSEFERSIREEEEITREANKTKIAFFAYRNALMHLIHHQDRSGETNQSTGVVGEGNDEEEDATERITQLEHQARSIVEMKSKACFDALSVAKEWESRREVRNLLLGQTKKSLAEEFKRRKECNGKLPKTSAGEEPINGSILRDTLAEIKIELKATAITKKHEMANTYVRLRKKPGKHPDCTFDTVFAVQCKEKKDKDDLNEKKKTDGNEKRRTSYRTTKWIRNIVKWRIHRQGA